MSDLEHAKDCPGSYDESFHTTNVCTCNLEQQLRAEIERLARDNSTFTASLAFHRQQQIEHCCKEVAATQRAEQAEAALATMRAAVIRAESRLSRIMNFGSADIAARDEDVQALRAALDQALKDTPANG